MFREVGHEYEGGRSGKKYIVASHLPWVPANNMKGKSGKKSEGGSGEKICRGKVQRKNMKEGAAKK